MGLFVTVTDDLICCRLTEARRQVIYAAPGISEAVARALGEAFKLADRLRVTVVLDGSEEACRVGYGDAKGLALVIQMAEAQRFAVQREPGLRAALLVTDDSVLVWSPTPRCVEDTAELGAAPNGVVLEATADRVADAVGAPEPGRTVEQAEIGREVLTREHVKQVVEATTKNPVVDFNLARKTGVFSSKFQFVETELRGAEWVEKEIKLSSLLMNVDLPEETRALLDTRVTPFANLKELRVAAPVMIEGQIAYNKAGDPIQREASQADIRRGWEDLKERYLIQVRSFGWLIRKVDVDAFEGAVKEFESTLKAWVTAFGKEIESKRESLLTQLTNAALQRMERSPSGKEKIDAKGIRGELDQSLSKMIGRSEVKIKRFYKAVAPASTRHDEFLGALQAALPKGEFDNWYKTWFAAEARQK